ncbi:Hypothetical predicted protein [Mytilus galloprovincialis]|uniref:Uncharacterized protein n=1 Tax=Mytilus galloprovincialis TaxID=29158 RepID=A0A8B6CZX5_MYTGA|nr:Hypothetical predicted protein [Mytilus galloprovincialis]
MNAISKIRELEVLKMKIDIDEKYHEKDKNKLVQEEEGKRQQLENVIGDLKNRNADQADKLNQLGQANYRKDKEIEEMKTRHEEMLKIKEELSVKISVLEEKIKYSSETCDQQQVEIKELKKELSRVEKELQVMKIDKMLQENAINGLKKELKQEHAEVKAQLDSIKNHSKESEKKLSEIAATCASLAKIALAKDGESNVNFHDVAHVNLSVNQNGGKTGMTVMRKAVPLRVFNPKIPRTGKKLYSSKNTNYFSRKDHQKTE